MSAVAGSFGYIAPGESQVFDVYSTLLKCELNIIIHISTQCSSTLVVRDRARASSASRRRRLPSDDSSKKN